MTTVFTPLPRRIRDLCCAAMAIGLMASATVAAEPTAAGRGSDTAWRTLPSYRHGNDMAPLLAIEAEAVQSMTPPEARAAMAARLAAVLGQPDATADARQWVCLLLRQVGTPAEVPLLARELSGSDSEIADAARQALESIPGHAATQALLDSLPRAEGRMRLGIIAALGRRRDAAAVPALAAVVDGGDPTLVHAAAGGLSFIAAPQAVATLRSLAQRTGVPTPRPLHEPLLRAAEAAAGAGDQASAHAIHELLARQGQPAALRQAALKGLLDTAAGDRTATILEWLAGDDADRRCVAAAGVTSLDDAALAAALAELERYAPQGQQAILTVACGRIPRAAEPTLIRLAGNGSDGLQVMAIECLGRMGSSESLAALLAILLEDAPGHSASPAQMAARTALAAMPREIVGPRLVQILAASAPPRQDVVALLGEIREPTAWDPLARIALAKEPAPWQAAVASLGNLAKPEAGDLAQLVDLYADAQERERREAVARIISLVSKQLSGGDPTRAVIATVDERGIPPEVALPLLGRMGSEAALAKIDAGLASPDASVRDAAIDGLCNWPDARVADRLLALARKSLAQPDQEPVGRQALRAYVRTVSLKSDRAPQVTLAMLEEAMALAADGPAEDRGYILERTAAAVRTMEAVEWIAGYLDTPSIAQAACRAIVELAHHKSLRRPHLDRLGPLLDRVATLADDPAVATRAQRYRLGL